MIILLKSGVGST